MFIFSELERHRSSDKQKEKTLLSSKRFEEIWSLVSREQALSVIIIIEGDPSAQNSIEKKAKSQIDEKNAQHMYLV